jgi:hypothetical protein
MKVTFLPFVFVVLFLASLGLEYASDRGQTAKLDVPQASYKW